MRFARGVKAAIDHEVEERTANRFAVTPVLHGARPLITVDSRTHGRVVGFPGEVLPLWAMATDRVEQADREFALDVVFESGREPIVRLIPPAEATDEVIAAMCAAYKRLGAHVRVLARERAQVAPMAPKDASVQHITVRARVLEVASGIKSIDSTALMKMVERTLDEEGL